jgi:error-prone DNA polymerase
VVEVAIVRPGPIQGGMVHPYLGPRKLARQSPSSTPARNRAGAAPHGVPIFQEQVMQLAMVAAGFTAGEADQRRAMGAWGRKGELTRYQDKLAAGMLARGYSADFAEALGRQIQGFGSYGFPESHAASFALLVYVSAWIKCFEPAAFLCGLLNSQPMGFYGPSQLIQDARRHHVEVLPADAAWSDWECTQAPSSSDPAHPAARLGLCLVKGFNRKAAERIAKARRYTLSGCRGSGPTCRAVCRGAPGHWQTRGPADAGGPSSSGVLGRCRLPDRTGTAPGNPRSRDHAPLPAPDETQEVIADYARLGFSLGRHPLSFLRGLLRANAS